MKKLELRRKEIKLLEHVLTKEGIKNDLYKLEAILKMKAPNSTKELRTFLGMTNYLLSKHKQLSRRNKDSVPTIVDKNYI